ncbi:hypothetical protein [Roseibium sp. Sym1]|uniref:hypothetical protein n=1 Tax=Roseibium sp. Sym1 TaxID=3016006 RepID=UPI0022B5A768|nr:hypothetical protein [Roseibium sp. Sym1]
MFQQNFPQIRPPASRRPHPVAAPGRRLAPTRLDNTVYRLAETVAFAVGFVTQNESDALALKVPHFILDDLPEPGALPALAESALLPAGHATRDEAIFAIPVIRHSLGACIKDLFARETAAAEGMFRIWLSGFTGRSPSM